MNDDQRHEDERLARLLASVSAEAEPALWTRVRARIEARERRPSWLGWVMRPAALGASLTLLAVSVVASVALVVTAPRTITAGATDDLTEALVAELGETGAAGTTHAAPLPADSGEAR